MMDRVGVISQTNHRGVGYQRSTADKRYVAAVGLIANNSAENGDGLSIGCCQTLRSGRSKQNAIL